MDASVIRTAASPAGPIGPTGLTRPTEPTGRTGQAQAGDAARDAALRDSAKAFETVFLKEMLSHAGLGEARDSFGGGVGEEGFASLLVEEHAKAVSEAGGLGLAEHIFEALKARSDGDV